MSKKPKFVEEDFYQVDKNLARAMQEAREMDTEIDIAENLSRMPSAEVPKLVSGPFVYYDRSAFLSDYSSVGMLMPVKKSVYDSKHDA